MSENCSADCGCVPDQRAAQDHPLSPRERFYHLTYGFGVSVLFSAADIAFLWPENHTLSLVFGASTLSIVTLYELTVIFPVRPWARAVVILAFWALAVAVRLVAGPILPDETDTHGVLAPGSDPRGCIFPQGAVKAS